MPDYQSILEDIYQKLSLDPDRGEVASYIPELANVDPNAFGIYLQLVNGESYEVGLSQTHISIQSISKVLTLAMAIHIEGLNLWERVDIEPSGNPFNQLSLLELESGIPRNPLINAGALVIADVLVTHFKEPKKEFLEFVRTVTNDQSIDYDQKVLESEFSTGFRNYAAANLLKAYDNLHNDVEEVLDFYFHQCSLSMTCAQLAKAFYMFANKGKDMQGIPRLKKRYVKRINAIMLTSGFYDEAGEFAFEVGLPGKSGVGGGIIALLPNEFVISVWSPGLNEKGNSKLGMEALEMFTTQSNLSIF
ncbi:glutaminase [Subsaximicrobium wynnwilliamsii]|jgi:glutaminase|uniref:Glutaminase n=1 Tax=Subsaximicrobium wynnwilliamsii TaxID=291179 RepID=A0A5C6ZJY0_9FLAO|nr:glutaminase [Subsaximicrobium wynnwilliamsii]TXD84843.1 glutaminase [Subsaximicrobium wynnwilliamsii]TXD90514.1 glutaminase [Subsaximicrobium wynnwilliamsii]TXE04989.1 glutaminase [Subsaximicrobium wynnwilliamsii]